MSYGDMNLTSGRLQQQQGLHGLDQRDSISISGEDVWEEIDLTDPSDVQRPGQLLLTPPDLSRVQAREGVDGAREVALELPGRPATKPVTEDVVVRHPITKHEIRVPREMLPSTIPSDMSHDQLTQMIQEKVTRGHGLVQMALHNRDFHPDPSNQRDVTDIMWFLHTQAEYKAGAHFHDGAISIEDPDGRLQAFLDKCQGHAYQRLSTHVEGFQDAPGGKPRGIDCYGDARNPDGLLPYGKQTILYQKMGQGSDGVRSMPRNMLFLKMEEFGAFSEGQQVVGRGPTRAENQHDRGAFWGHVGTTIKSICRRICGLNTPEGSRKERVSSGMQKAYDKLSSWSLFRSNLPSGCRDILKSGKPGNTASGVRTMHQNINDAIQWLRTNNGTPQQIQKLQDFQQKYLSNPQWDHLEMRIGNEVIITQDDLDNPDQLVHAEGTTALQLTRSVNKDDLIEGCEDDIYGMLHAPEGSDTHRDLQPTEHGVSQQFKKDFMDRAGALKIGGKEIPWNPNENPPGLTRLNALKEFFTDKDGNLDEQGMLTASRLLNQAVSATFGRVLQTEEDTRVFPGAPMRQTGTQQAFELSRDTQGRVHIRVSLDQDTLDLANPRTGAMVDLEEIGGAHLHQEMGIMMPGHGARSSDVEVVDVTYKMTTND